MEINQDGSQKSLMMSPLLWAGAAVIVLGVAFNFGLFFAPLTAAIRDPQLVPMPEALLGWWAVGIGVVMVVWSLFRRGQR